MDWDLLLKIIGPIIAFGALIFSFFVFGIKTKDELIAMNERTNERITKTFEAIAEQNVEVCTRLAVLETKIGYMETRDNEIWNSLKTNIVNMLKSMPTIEGFEKDQLLTKYQHNELTLEEAQKLREILLYEKDLPENKNLAWAYVMTIAGLVRTIKDLRREPIEDGQYVDNHC